MGKVTIQQTAMEPWGQVLVLSNGTVEVIATLDIGPRIIRYGMVGGPNLFFEDHEQHVVNSGEAFDRLGGGAWHLYGGHRLWASPEEHPRTYYPDNEKVHWKECENGINLTPEPEKWTQLQKEIQIRLEENGTGVAVTHRVTNCGPWPIEFAPWALSVMAPGGVEVVPQTSRDTGLLGNRILALWPYSRMNDQRVHWGDKYITLHQNPEIQQAFKFGSTNEDGWAAYFNFDQLFLKFYKHNPEGAYPDFGVSFETYTNNYFLEMETLGELKRTAPGETVVHEERWLLAGNVRLDKGYDEEEISKILNPYL